MAPRVLFLPGTVGSPDFWRPVAARLAPGWEKVHLGWPGAGDEPHDPAIRGFDDLVARAGSWLAGPTDVVAQSMGGLVALRLALAHPGSVRRLVLAATSAGIDPRPLGGVDWREDYRQRYPCAAAWITCERPAELLTVSLVTAPTLLLWGTDDPISPLAVGRRLAGLLPDATLRVIPGGTHDFAREDPDPVARLIARHLDG